MRNKEKAQNQTNRTWKRSDGILQKRIADYIRKHIKQRRTRAIAAALSICTAASVFMSLSMPGISLAHSDFAVTAERTEAFWSEELQADVHAEASGGQEETWFVLHTDGRNAGFSGQYSFHDDTAHIPLDDGGELALHRQLRDDGGIDYFFMLLEGTSADFALWCAALEQTGFIPAEQEDGKKQAEQAVKDKAEKELQEKELQEQEQQEKERKEQELQEQEQQEKERKEQEAQEQEQQEKERKGQEPQGQEQQEKERKEQELQEQEQQKEESKEDEQEQQVEDTQEKELQEDGVKDETAEEKDKISEEAKPQEDEQGREERNKPEETGETTGAPVEKEAASDNGVSDDRPAYYPAAMSYRRGVPVQSAPAGAVVGTRMMALAAAVIMPEAGDVPEAFLAAQTGQSVKGGETETAGESPASEQTEATPEASAVNEAESAAPEIAAEAAIPEQSPDGATTEEDATAEAITAEGPATEATTEEDSTAETTAEEDSSTEASIAEDSTVGDSVAETTTVEDSAAEASTEKDSTAETTEEDSATETSTVEDSAAEASTVEASTAEAAEETESEEQPSSEAYITTGNPAQDGGELTLRWGSGASLEEAQENAAGGEPLVLTWLAGSERAAGVVHDIEWSVGDPGTEISEDKTHLEITPANSKEKSVVARAHFSLGRKETIEPGEVEIRVPAHIFKDRDGEWVGSYKLDVPEALAGPDGKTAFSYTYDSATDEIVLANHSPMDGAQFFSCDITYSYWPANVANKYSNEQIRAAFTYPNEDGTAGKPVFSEHTLSIVNHTSTKLNNTKKEGKAVFWEWDERWGEAPADAENYFYVVWRNFVSTELSPSTQPVSVTVKDWPQKDGGTPILTGSFVNNKFFVSGKVEEKMPSVVKDQNYRSREELERELEPALYVSPMYVLFKYPRSLVEDLTGDEYRELTNTATVMLQGMDEDISETKEMTGSYRIEADVVRPNGKIFYLAKDGVDSKGSLTLLRRGMDMPGKYDVYFRHLGHNDIETREITLTDEEMSLGKDKLGEKKALTAGEDYHFTGATLSFRQADARQDETGRWIYTNLTEQAFDEFRAEAQVNGVWEPMDVSEKLGESPENGCAYRLDVPEGTTAVRVSYRDTKGYSQLRLSLDVLLHPTDKLVEEAKKASNMPVYNYIAAELVDPKQEYEKLQWRVVGAGQHPPLSLTSYEKKRIGTPQNDSKNERMRWPVAVWNEEYAGGDLSIAERFANRFTRGKFYDLLPKGASAENIKVVRTRGKTAYEYGSSTTEAVNHYETEYRYDWKGSGRMMMIVSYNSTEPIELDEYTGVALTYDMVCSHDSIFDNQKHLDNYAAYQSECGPLYEGKGDTYPNLRWEKPDSPWHFFKDLDGNKLEDKDKAATVYAKDEVAVTEPLSMQGGYHKWVRPIDGVYSQDAQVLHGGEYVYKLRFQNGQGSVADQLIFYDVLENNAPQGTPFWQGRLKEVNTSFAESRGAAPVVYYSMKQGIAPYGSEEGAPTEDGRLEDTTVWSKDKPDDMVKVTAVAIDLRQGKDGAFFLKDEAAVYVEILMEAVPKEPIDYEKAGRYPLKAYNRSGVQVALSNKAGQGVPSVQPANPVTVTMHETTSLNVTKVWDDRKAPAGSPVFDHSDDEITVELRKVTGESTEPTGQELKLNLANLWTGTFDDLDVRNEKGEPVAYTVAETGRTGEHLDGYYAKLQKKDTPAGQDEASVQSWVITNIYDPNEKHIALRINKKAADGGEALAGAAFTLYEAKIGADGTWSKTQDETVVEQGQTQEDGSLIFEKLPAGRYLLYETTAPEGYNLSKAQPWRVTAKKQQGADGGTVWNVSVTDRDGNVVTAEKGEDGMYGLFYQFDVYNEGAYALPKTGGRGTAPYTAGGIFVMAAALAGGGVVYRRRSGRG